MLVVVVVPQPTSAQVWPAKKLSPALLHPPIKAPSKHPPPPTVKQHAPLGTVHRHSSQSKTLPGGQVTVSPEVQPQLATGQEPWHGSGGCVVVGAPVVVLPAQFMAEQGVLAANDPPSVAQDSAVAPSEQDSIPAPG